MRVWENDLTSMLDRRNIEVEELSTLNRKLEKKVRNGEIKLKNAELHIKDLEQEMEHNRQAYSFL